MGKTKMNQAVDWGMPWGIATPRQMLDNGTAELEVCENFHAPRSKKGTRRAVFVTIKGTGKCVEVSGYVKPAKPEGSEA